MINFAGNNNHIQFTQTGVCINLYSITHIKYYHKLHLH